MRGGRKLRGGTVDLPELPGRGVLLEVGGLVTLPDSAEEEAPAPPAARPALPWLASPATARSLRGGVEPREERGGTVPRLLPSPPERAVAGRLCSPLGSAAADPSLGWRVLRGGTDVVLALPEEAPGPDFGALRGDIDVVLDPLPP